ncbi:hypothetical protein CSPX01_08947 [Colletotrichum filicis]|nr:hypothetical protein CSPX01_08947 [Colletotrichum filicis]
MVFGRRRGLTLAKLGTQSLHGPGLGVPTFPRRWIRCLGTGDCEKMDVVRVMQKMLAQTFPYTSSSDVSPSTCTSQTTFDKSLNYFRHELFRVNW